MLSALVLSAFLQFGLVQGGSVLYTYPGEAYQSFPPLYATFGGELVLKPFFYRLAACLLSSTTSLYRA